MRVIPVQSEDFKEAFEKITSRRHQVLDHYQSDVKAMIEAYRAEREACLLECARELDQVELTEDDLWVSADLIKSSHRMVAPEVKAAIEHTKTRVEHIQEELKLSSFQSQEGSGVYWGMEVRSVERVGIYVPRDNFLSLMLCAIPARIAGVEELIVATPPQKRHDPTWISSEVLYAAKLLDIKKILLSGGVAGISALAFGTKNSEPVEKVVGAGGKLTMAAKQALSGYVGIDGLTGPMEVTFVCDKSTAVDVLAADILGIAATSGEAEINVFGTDESWFEKLIEEQLAQSLDALKGTGRDKIHSCLSNRTNFFLTRSVDQALEYANQIAPGILCLPIDDAAEYVSKIKACGSLLLGKSTSPVSLDLVGGATGVVSTFGSALYTNAMSPITFTRRFSVVEIESDAVGRLQKESMALAEAEGFTDYKGVYETRTGEE